MYRSPQWGNVNLGVDVLQGHGEQSQPGQRQFHREHPGSKNKEQYNPGRNQELNIPPDVFRMQKGSDYNPYSSNSKMAKSGIHERIKELMGEGQSKNEAVVRAKQEANDAKMGDVGTISKKDVYRYKYQAPSPFKQVSPFTEQSQETVFM
jgi:hypothetical protein